MSISTDHIIQLLGEQLGVETSQITADTPLFSSGLLDSFSMVALVTALEKQYGMKIRATDLTLANFDSPISIVAYITRS